jgi:Family of unknown function (DUF6256)
MSSSLLIRQDLVPMIIGYALIMGSLAAGLRLARRPGSAAEVAGDRGPAGRPAVAGRPGPAGRAALAGRVRRSLRVAARLKPGWPRLIAHYLGTAVGGYLLLMIIIILYYLGVAPVSGNFIQSAFTGCALLIGLSLPVFLALSWLAERKGWRF